MTRSARIVDIDGTLALDVGRKHLRPKAEPHCLHQVPHADKIAYLSPVLVGLDMPVPAASHYFDKYRSSIFGDTIIITGRWEALRSTTVAWLRQHLPCLSYTMLLMRRMHDDRPSVVVKMELAKTVCDVGEWIDDDEQMLRVAQQAGFVARLAPDHFEDCIWFYATSNTMCGVCGKPYARHQPHHRQKHLQQLCDGSLVKL